MKCVEFFIALFLCLSTDAELSSNRSLRRGGRGDFDAVPERPEGEEVGEGEESLPDEGVIERCQKFVDDDTFWDRRTLEEKKTYGLIINNSGHDIKCHPENPPPDEIIVPNGKTEKIDAVFLENNKAYKIVDGCTLTVSAPPAGERVRVSNFSTECDSVKSKCGQIIKGGVTDRWW